MVTANTNEDKPSLTRLFGLIMLAELGVNSNAHLREPYRLGAMGKCEAGVHVAVDEEFEMQRRTSVWRRFSYDTLTRVISQAAGQMRFRTHEKLRVRCRYQRLTLPAMYYRSKVIARHIDRFACGSGLEAVGRGRRRGIRDCAVSLARARDGSHCLHWQAGRQCVGMLPASYRADSP